MGKFAIDSVIYVEAESLDQALEYAADATGRMVDEFEAEDGNRPINRVEFIDGSEVEE